MKNIGNYRVETFPESRLGTIDIGAISQKKHFISAFFELDVTTARKLIQERKQQGETISFTAFLIYCIGRALSNHQELHAVRKSNRKIVIFDDVDVSVMIEREINGKKVPLPYVVRKANEKDVKQITQELKSGKSQLVGDQGNYVLGEAKNARTMKLYYALPGFIRRWVWHAILGNPMRVKEYMGTVMMTSVGMMGKLNGWVLPKSVHPISFSIGSIVKKPGVINNQIEIREAFFVTVSIDHDVVDGAPAIRTLDKLVKMIESGFGLTPKGEDHYE